MLNFVNIACNNVKVALLSNVAFASEDVNIWNRMNQVSDFLSTNYICF